MRVVIMKVGNEGDNEGGKRGWWQRRLKTRVTTKVENEGEGFLGSVARQAGGGRGGGLESWGRSGETESSVVVSRVFRQLRVVDLAAAAGWLAEEACVVCIGVR